MTPRPANSNAPLTLADALALSLAVTPVREER